MTSSTNPARDRAATPGPVSSASSRTPDQLPDPLLLSRSRDLAACCSELVASTLDGAKSVALLDIPNHDNPGDAAILLGEMAMLGSIGVSVDYLADLRSFSTAHWKQAVPQGPTVLHGGGNVGDVYPLHQQFRETFMTSHPQAWTIQLPQSVFFRDEQHAMRARQLYASHPRLKFLARDSLAASRTVNQLGITPALCPDSAFALVHDRSLSRGLIRGVEPIVYLLRSDRESARDGVAPEAAEDWEFTARRRTRLAIRVASRATPFLPRLGAPLSQVSPRGNLRLARRLVRSAAEQVARSQVLVTDRLHGMIIAAVLGVPHVALDNLNGKVHAFQKDWLDGLASSRRASSLEEADEVAAELLCGAG